MTKRLWITASPAARSPRLQVPRRGTCRCPLRGESLIPDIHSPRNRVTRERRGGPETTAGGHPNSARRRQRASRRRGRRGPPPRRDQHAGDDGSRHVSATGGASDGDATSSSYLESNARRGGDHQQHLALRWSLGARAQGTASWCAPISASARVSSRSATRPEQPITALGSWISTMPFTPDISMYGPRSSGCLARTATSSTKAMRVDAVNEVGESCRPGESSPTSADHDIGCQIAPDIGCDLGVRVPDRVTTQIVRTLAALVVANSRRCRWPRVAGDRSPV